MREIKDALSRERVIWDNRRVAGMEAYRIEFPHLARFQDHWYCAFREGRVHDNDISGRGRVIRSRDGSVWDTVALLDSAVGDVRDPRLSVTSHGQLMVHSSIRFIPDAAPLELVDGVAVHRRSVTWLSDDGEHWSAAHACPSGINTWRWDVAWHDGYGYSFGYGGKDERGTLYRTADGKTWETWSAEVFPARRGNEAALSFGADGVGYCLLRAGGGGRAALGTAAPPYRDWTWRELDVCWDASGKREPLYRVADRDLGGPNLITVADGRLLGAARVGGASDRPSGVTLFWVDPREAILTRMVTVQGGSSYPGLVEHEQAAWFTYSRAGETWPVCLASMPIPAALDAVGNRDRGGRQRRAAIESCKDAGRLARAAREDENRHVRRAAVERLSDATLLAAIAVQDPSWEIRNVARSKIDGAIGWGEWFFRKDSDDRGEAETWYTQPVGDKDWRVIDVPAFWKQTWVGGYLGIGWYGVTFELPSGKGVRRDLSLLFEGVDSQAWVYVNGREVGRHTVETEGGDPDKIWDTPFTVRVPAAELVAEGLNVLMVRVQAGRCNGGIHQPILASRIRSKGDAVSEA